MTEAAKETGSERLLSGMSVVDGSDDRLREWYRQYMEADADRMKMESPLITEVQHDTLDATGLENAIEKASETVRVEKGFCVGCTDMFNNWPTIGRKHGAHGIARHIRTHEMEAARRKGCRCCALLVSQVDAEVLDTVRKLEKRLDVLGSSESCSISVWNWGSVRGTQCLWVNLPGKVTTDSNTSLAQLWDFESHVVPPHTNRNDEPVGRFELVKAWLQKCTDEHKQCKSRKPAERPRRLVCIADESIKLVLTESLTEMPRYATLSYCWGNKDFFKLTNYNLKECLKEIPEEELPKTFTNAIFTARALGVQYIWIDALCIVQEESNHLDWISECGKMRSVYGSAYVNIAATTATDVHEGLFTMRPDYNGGFLARVSTSEYCCVRNFHTRDTYDAATCKTHLATRAWTLQERLLAPRTMYLGNRGCFCECRTTWISEFLPEGSPDVLGPQLVVPDDTPWNWSEIVAQYSASRLTKATDKLPALSGIVRSQHEVTGGHYLAGMWKENLLRQLVWVTSEGGERPEWRAPSWSWASLDAPMYYWGYWSSQHKDAGLGSDEFAQVLDVWTTPAESDPFGAVTDGELRMSCRALVCGSIAFTEEQEEAKKIVTIDTTDERFTLFMDTQNDESIKPGEKVMLLPLIKGKSGSACFTQSIPTGGGESKDKAQNLQRDVPAASEVEPNDHEDSDSELGEMEWEEILIRGLVLSCLNKRLGIFRRIGLFDFRHQMLFLEPDIEKDQYTEFMRILEEVGTSTAASWCAETLPDSVANNMPYLIIIK